MSHTPTGTGLSVRSRASSRTLSKTPPRAFSVPPSLRPSPSLSNLHIHIHNVESSPIPPVPPLPVVGGQASELHSTASSVINMDMSEGILLQDADITAEEAEDVITGIVGVNSIGDGDGNGQMDDETKDALREHLRKTLREQATKPDSTPLKSHLKGKQKETEELPFEAAPRYPSRQYFVLTDAGKPVFVSRPGNDDASDMDSSTIFGIMQALISVFLDDGDKLRYINAGRTRISFLLRSPLYYACASSWGSPSRWKIRSHLEYLHLQILSIVSAAQLRRIFERRTNFDLRRLLSGAENLLYSMLERLEFDLAISTSSLQCLRLDGNLRRKIGDILVPASKTKDILYVVLIAQGKVVTLIRPKKHSIHPADIQILLNTIHSPSIMNSPASSSWIPVCLPKFNPACFVNAYISFLRRSGDSSALNTPSLDMNEAHNQESSGGRRAHPQHTTSEVTLVCVSSGGDFEAIRTWCDAVVAKLERDNLSDSLARAALPETAEYSASSLGIPGLRHFIYKSRQHIQITSPVFEDPYDGEDDKRRLITLYQTIHDAIHAKSGQEGPLKLQYIRTDKESVLGWITQPFELYITTSPLLPKTAIIGAANSVTRWIKREESRLFLRDAPVF